MKLEETCSVTSLCGDEIDTLRDTVNEKNNYFDQLID